MATITKVRSYHKLVIREYTPTNTNPTSVVEYYWNSNDLIFDKKVDVAFYFGSSGPSYQFPLGGILSYTCDSGTSTKYIYTDVNPFGLPVKNGASIEISHNDTLCGVLLPCNLVINDVTVTGETAVNANDGTITIHATGGGDIEYSMSLFSTYQSSNVFTGVAPGAYIIHARLVDSITCTAVSNLLIVTSFGSAGPELSPRWKLEYTNAHDELVEIKIFQKAYEGSVEEVCGTSTPLIEKTDRGGDLSFFTPIKSSQAVISFISDSELKFKDIFSGDPLKFRAEIKKDGQYSFIGFLIPDVYTEAYKNPPTPVTFTAVDGLQLLKKEPFEDIAPGVKTILEVINVCLKITTLQLNIITAFEFSVNGVDLYGADPSDPNYESLNEVRIDTNIFINNGLTFYDVLERILESVHCTLFQNNGKWYVIDIALLASNITLREWDSNLNYLGNFSVDTLLQVTCASGNPINTFTGSEASISFLPAFQNQKVSFERQIDDNLITGGEFSLEDFYHNGVDYTDIPLHWAVSSGLYVKRLHTIDKDEDTYAIGIYENSTPDVPGGFIESTTTYKAGVGFEDLYRFKFRYKVVLENVPESGSESLVVFELKYGGRWYDGEGNNFPTPVQIELPVSSFNRFHEYELEFDRGLTYSGPLVIKFFQGVGKDNIVDYVAIRACSLRFLPGGDVAKKVIEHTEDIGLNFKRIAYQYIPKPKVVKISDPSTPYFQIVKNKFRVPAVMVHDIFGESSLYGWRYKNGTSARSMIEWQARRILDANSSAVMVLSGQMFTKATIFNTFQDSNLENKIFMIAALTRDDFKGIVSIELLELSGMSILQVESGMLFENVNDNEIQFEDFENIKC